MLVVGTKSVHTQFLCLEVLWDGLIIFWHGGDGFYVTLRSPLHTPSFVNISPERILITCKFRLSISKNTGSNFEAICLSDMRIRDECTRCARGGWVKNWKIISTLPSPDPFGDRKMMLQGGFGEFRIYSLIQLRGWVASSVANQIARLEWDLSVSFAPLQKFKIFNAF